MTSLELTGQIALALAILVSGAALGGNLFDILINEENLLRGFPESVEHIRRYWVYRNPGDFYKRITPAFFGTGLVALLIFWDEAYGRRAWIGGALTSYALTQGITVVYFFPQNRLLREGSLDEIKRLFREFSTTRLYLDLLRNLLTLAAGVCLLVALTRPLA